MEPQAEVILLSFKGRHMNCYCVPSRQTGFNLVRSSNQRFFEGRLEHTLPQDSIISNAETQDFKEEIYDTLPDRKSSPLPPHLDDQVIPVLDAWNIMPMEDDPLPQSIPEALRPGRGRPVGSNNKPDNSIDPSAIDLSGLNSLGRITRSMAKGPI